MLTARLAVVNKRNYLYAVSGFTTSVAAGAKLQWRLMSRGAAFHLSVVSPQACSNSITLLQYSYPPTIVLVQYPTYGL